MPISNIGLFKKVWADTSTLSVSEAVNKILDQLPEGPSIAMWMNAQTFWSLQITKVDTGWTMVLAQNATTLKLLNRTAGGIWTERTL